jgi:4'-phosphopantetheinyl transferase
MPAFGLVWFEQLDADLPATSDWLSPREQDQLAAFRILKRRDDRRLGRWTAKLAIAGTLCLPRSDFSSIEIRPAPGGVPQAYLRGALLPVAISISHRDGHAVCAISENGRAIGCDIELIEPRSDAFVADYFTEPEQALINSFPDQRSAVVTILWSAKESALKALGEGLRMDTRSVTASQHSLDAIAAITSSGSRRNLDWHALTIISAVTGQTFTGAWQQHDNLIRTLIVESRPSHS